MTVITHRSENPAFKSGAEDRVLPGGWYTLFAMLVVVLFAFVDRQLLILAAGPLAKSLALTDSQLGLVQGLAFSVFSVAAVYPIAWLADRYDRRLVLGGCLILWSLGTLACGFVQNFWQLFLSAVAIASGEAALAPLTMAFVPDLFKGRKRILANSIQYIFIYLGISMALGMGGSALGLLDRLHPDLPASLRSFEPWRLAFILVCTPMPILLMLVSRARLGRADSNDVERVPSAPVAPMAGFLRAHWRAILPVLGGLASYMFAYAGFMVWLPLVGNRLFAATPEMNGYGMGLASGVGTCCGVAIGYTMMRFYIPKLGARAAVGVSWRLLLATIPILAVFPFVQTAAQMYTCMGVMTLAGTGVGSLNATMLQEMAPASLRTRFFGLWSVVSALLAGIAPSIAGLMSDAIGGQRGLLYAIIAVAFPGWLASIALLHRGERTYADLVSAAKDSPLTNV